VIPDLLGLRLLEATLERLIISDNYQLK